jgi:glucose/arabinose dehydrogenase
MPNDIRIAMGVTMSILFLAGCGAKDDSGDPRGNPSFTPAFDTDKANSFRLPVWFGEVPGRPDAYVVVERGDGAEDAHAWVLTRSGAGYTRKVFLTLPVETSASPSDERGFLGFAFHPDYARNRKYYLNYIRKRPEGASHDSTVVEERIADSTLLGDAGLPPRRILAFAQPYSNHNGGTLAFGPKDGFLYIGTGDGGSGGDPQHNGQSLVTFLGKLLRIDVDDTAGGRPYGIPGDNPFATGSSSSPASGGEVRKEIWAYGLRNPWKWSFDPATGDLWVGDVGQNKHEEVDRVGRGDNLGWNRMEAGHCFEPAAGCDKTGLKLPEAEFDRAEATSITGGYVYRGDSASSWNGTYLFGDFNTLRFFALPPGHVAGAPALRLGRLPDKPSAFGVDAHGGLYFLGYGSGTIYRITLP